MKKITTKNCPTVDEVMDKFEQDSLYRTLSAVTRLLGEPARLLGDFSRLTNGGLTIVKVIEEIYCFFEEFVTWSNKLQYYMYQLQNDAIFCKNTVFRVRFLEVLPKVIDLIQSSSKPLLFSSEIDKNGSPFALILKIIDNFFKRCVALESKLAQLVEDFKILI